MRFIYAFRLALTYLKARPFATVVSVFSIGFSLALLVVVGNINFALKKVAAEGAIKYPLILAPEGASGVQAVMSTIFYVDKPVGTIPFSVYEKVKGDDRVLAAYPLAMADNLQNFPIIGVDAAFVENLGTGFAAGKLDFSKHHNVVVGINVARRLGLSTGDRFFGSHGMSGSEGAHEHKELEYVITGILNPGNGPEDSAIYAPYESVWYAHGSHSHDEAAEHAEHAEHAEGEDHHHNGPATDGAAHDHADHEEAHHHDQKLMLSSGKLTGVLVKTKNPVFTSQLEREWSLENGVQAVDTGRTLKRVIGYLNKAETGIKVFTSLMLIIIIILILVTIMMSLNERKKELALMRSLGIGRGTVSLVIMTESMIITLGGAVLGIVLGHTALWWAQALINSSLGVSIEPFTVTFMELSGFIITLFAGQILAVITMIWCYRINIVEEIARD